jgi:surface antigen
MLASSKNFSDYVDKQQYLDRIKDHVQEAAAIVQQQQDQLKKQQASLNAMLASLATQQSSVVTLKSQQADLLTQTQGQEAAYQKLVSDNKSKLSGLYAERAALDARNGVTIAVGGNGGYPYANSCTAFTSSCVDPWGYYYRQCVSFAAWHRLYYKDGDGGNYSPIRWGNAGEWVNHAPWDRNPSVGAIAVFPAFGSSGAGSVGHVAIVIADHGSTVDLSEYNWRPYAYSTRYNVPVADIHFIH